LSDHESEIRIDAVHHKLNIELLVDLAFKIKILPDLTEKGNVIVAVNHGSQANVTIETKVPLVVWIAGKEAQQSKVQIPLHLI
jgi:hypothetical protein